MFSSGNASARHDSCSVEDRDGTTDVVPIEVIESLRILLLAGLGLSVVLAIVVLRGDADATWFRRYLDEHPGLRQDFEMWRRHRRRKESLAAGRCPDHDLLLTTSGQCTQCRRRPHD